MNTSYVSVQYGSYFNFQTPNLSGSEELRTSLWSSMDTSSGSSGSSGLISVVSSDRGLTTLCDVVVFLEGVLVTTYGEGCAVMWEATCHESIGCGETGV